jgi:hypothetical protein
MSYASGMSRWTHGKHNNADRLIPIGISDWLDMFELITTGKGKWHVEYIRDGKMSRAYCGQQIRSPIATNITLPPQSAVCKECARLTCELEKCKHV